MAEKEAASATDKHNLLRAEDDTEEWTQFYDEGPWTKRDLDCSLFYKDTCFASQKQEAITLTMGSFQTIVQSTKELKQNKLL